MPSLTVQQATDLALQYHQAGRRAEAEQIYRQILAVEPQHSTALHFIGVLAHQAGRNELAVEWMRRSIEVEPNHSEFHSNLGEVYRTIGRLDEAIASLRRAIQLKPDYAEVHNNLGNALREKGRPDEAIVEVRRAIELKPALAEAHTNLGNALKDQGRLDEAMNSYRRATELKPHDSLLRSNLVYTALFNSKYDWTAVREECARWESQFAAPLMACIRPHANDRDSTRRLKVGYVSPDFTGHVISRFFIPLIEAHDPTACEIFCYASVKRPDENTARIRKSAHVWRDVLGVSHEDLAEIIRRDQVDILVDLTQHMADNRLEVFARKPAPVQVAWLGYPGTTGLHAIDYRFTDHFMEPEGAVWSESVETPVRLPDSWFCFDPVGDYPAPGELPALRTGAVTFGSLNNFCKMNAAVLERWARVLAAVEGSRLLLQCPQGECGARVLDFFATRGIAKERIHPAPRVDSSAEFLALFERIDMALDPFPYNGGTTTCEALWMGIPVLTLPGETIVSRIGLSILSAAGMGEFVAHSEAEYVQLAARLAGDLPGLAQLRATLRGRMKASPFMDGPRFARNVERAYREMWRAWCAKTSVSR